MHTQKTQNNKNKNALTSNFRNKNGFMNLLFY